VELTTGAVAAAEGGSAGEAKVGGDTASVEENVGRLGSIGGRRKGMHKTSRKSTRETLAAGGGGGVERTRLRAREWGIMAADARKPTKQNSTYFPLITCFFYLFSSALFLT
jgi:hypothetical protein